MKKLTIAAVLTLVSISHLGSVPVPDKPSGLLETNTLFTIYGRGFGRAPILGRLGSYSNMGQMAAGTGTWIKQIKAASGGKGVVVGIHLIYALAVPCTGKGACLEYLDQLEDDLVARYVKPAADRGWTVILDTQLGQSDPVAQVQRMMDRGYLKYDNVHVALDPEFHVVRGHSDPGIPIGTVTAAQINAVQDMLSGYVGAQKLKTRKILIVHQFGDPAVHDGVPFMIQDKSTLRDFANVELVIDADGLGSPEEKVRKYNLMTDRKTYPFLQFSGIKVFFPNRWEHAGHFDKPPMTVDQVFGLAPVPGGARMATKPGMLTIA